MGPVFKSWMDTITIKDHLIISNPSIRRPIQLARHDLEDKR